MERILSFSDEHRMFKDAFSKFVANEMVPHYQEWEDNEIVPHEIYEIMGN